MAVNGANFNYGLYPNYYNNQVENGTQSQMAAYPLYNTSNTNQQDAVSFSGKKEEKKNKHTLLKLGVLIATGVIVKRNWGKISKYAKELFKGAEATTAATEGVVRTDLPELAQKAVENAERCSKPFTTSAEQIERNLGIKTGKELKGAARRAFETKYERDFLAAEKERALEIARNSSKPFTTSAEQIERNLGIKTGKELKGAARRAFEAKYERDWLAAEKPRVALEMARTNSKPFATSAQEIERNLGIPKEVTARQHKSKQALYEKLFA